MNEVYCTYFEYFAKYRATVSGIFYRTVPSPVLKLILALLDGNLGS